MTNVNALTQMNERGGITLPKSVRGELPSGSLFEVVRREDGVIELRPKLLIDAEQSWFWTKRWQRMEREADADVAAGRIERFDDAESFLAELDS
jgi:hypothetical protein